MGDISTGELCNGRYKGVNFLATMAVLCTRRGVGGGVDGLQSNFSSIIFFPTTRTQTADGPLSTRQRGRCCFDYGSSGPCPSIPLRSRPRLPAQRQQTRFPPPHPYSPPAFPTLILKLTLSIRIAPQTNAGKKADRAIIAFRTQIVAFAKNGWVAVRPPLKRPVFRATTTVPTMWIDNAKHRVTIGFTKIVIVTSKKMPLDQSQTNTHCFPKQAP